jgi:16S rRNA processing protein RimM
LLLAGEIGKPHGLAGEVYVVVISDDPHRFEPGAELHHSDGRMMTVESSRAHGARFLVKFAGIDGREAAAALRGALYVPSSQARPLDDDEFWHDDLVGCTVVGPDGSDIGTVSAVVAGPAQDRLEVATAAGPRLVPLVKEIVTTVDLDARKIVLDPPEGLLD